jgi:hypothetical protein
MDIDTVQLDRHIEKWHILKQEVADLERKLNKHKNKIKTYMETNNIDKLQNSANTIVIDYRNVNSSRMTRNCVPPAIWNQYSTPSSYKVYSIRKVGTKRSPTRSPTRSPSSRHSR